MRTPGLALLAVVTCLASALAAGWQTYVNERFGTTADVPADWIAGEPPSNGDGLRFTSPDGAATITVSGSFQTFDSLDDALISYAWPLDGETVTYQHAIKDGVVVSGLKGDRIFYRKTVASCGQSILNTVALEYPAAEKRGFDALVTHVGKSLHGGKGAETGDCRN